jgi:hypothetical protein
MMQGICNKCACVCVLDEVWEQYGCPACRAARAVEELNTIDSLQDHDGRPYTNSEQHLLHWYGPNPFPDREVWVYEKPPQGCRIPKGDAAQCYELRRMFRL